MPIPLSKLPEFVGYMEAFDNDDMPDGAWFQMLEDAATEFMKMNKIKGDSNSAVHLYLQQRHE